MAVGQWHERRQRTRERWKGRQQSVSDLWKTGHRAWCQKEGNNSLYAIDEDESENIEEAPDSDEDLQAWCSLE